MYEQLLKNVSPGVELWVYPYVMDLYNQQMWRQFSPNGDSIAEGIFAFTEEWNSFLKSKNSSLRFSGIVWDYEEFMFPANQIVLDEVLNVAPLKKKYGFKTGISIGYQPWASYPRWNPIMDEYYCQFYDYSYVHMVDRTLNSPFLLYANQPQKLADFTIETVLEGLSEDKARYPPKVQVMWSIQSIKNDCIYTMSDGSCGLNWEFGTWNAKSMNMYLAAFKQGSPNLGVQPQGFFQFSFTPKSWLIPSN